MNRMISYRVHLIARSNLLSFLARFKRKGLKEIYQLSLQCLSVRLYICRSMAFSQSDCTLVDCVWYVMAHAQKPDFVFRRNGRVHLNRQGRQFSRLLAAEVFASAVVMLGTPCSEVVWRVLATHSIHQFPLHFPSRASPCAITFQLESTYRSTGGISIKFGIEEYY
jgi:hypothetical protein